RDFENSRPSDEAIKWYVSWVKDFFDNLLEKCQEYNEVFVQCKRSANYYREHTNHLLFRPVGQRAFAKAVQVMVKRGSDLDEAVSVLLNADMHVESKNWHNILWDPIGATMITNKLALAETQLLSLAGQQARGAKHLKDLEKLLAVRD